jgi:hypothetical protein
VGPLTLLNSRIKKSVGFLGLEKLCYVFEESLILRK